MSLNFLEYFKSKPPKLIADRYRLLERLSVNGCEQTLLALDLHAPGQPRRILKELQLPFNSASEVELIRELFESDAQTLAKLGNHDRIPQLLDRFEGDLATEDSAEPSVKEPEVRTSTTDPFAFPSEQNTFYRVQPIIEGHALEAELTTPQPWSDQEVVAFLTDILGTLEFIHQQRALHLNVQPSSLFRRDRDRRIVLTNFGAFQQTSARLLSPVPTISTPPVFEPSIYMPDEQAAGHPQPSSDVYAVGIIAIQALTGQRLDTIPTHPQTRARDWHSLASLSHPALLALLDYMVQDNFRTRCQSAAEALNALSALPPELTWAGLPAIDLTKPKRKDAKSEAAPIDYSLEDCTSVEEKYISIEERFARQDAADPTTVAYEAERSRRKLMVPVGVGLIALVGVGALIWRTADPTRLIADAPSAIAKPSSQEIAQDSSTAQTTDQPTNQTAKDSQSAPLLEPESETGERAASESAPSTAADRSAEERGATSGNIAAARVSDRSGQSEESSSADRTGSEAIAFNRNAADSGASASTLTSESATATVNSFYDNVSSRSWDTVRSLLSEDLAQQLEPNFFYQFQDVSVENLRIQNQTSEAVDLVVQNTYVYLDGSFQQEERSYTIQMIGDRPTIVDTAFLEVTKDRSYSN